MHASKLNLPHDAASASCRRGQNGAVAIEFALVALMFLTLVFGIMEFGRFMYLYNTVQEVTRRAARQATVTWTSQHSATAFRQSALLGGNTLPAAGEVGTANLSIDYLDTAGQPMTSMPADPAENVIACQTGSAQCVGSIRVSLSGVTYTPSFRLFDFLNVQVPASTVVIPVESLGY